MRLALFQPDIPQNLGAAIRLCACLGVSLEVIEPCGFPLSAKELRRTAMDYSESIEVMRRNSWSHFISAPERKDGRLLLFTTKSAQPFTDFSYEAGDTLLFGRESAGAPEEVHAAADGRLFIPIEGRSLNVTHAAAMALGEALRQTGGFPSVRI